MAQKVTLKDKKTKPINGKCNDVSAADRIYHCRFFKIYSPTEDPEAALVCET
jgi:hypothetical protein